MAGFSPRTSQRYAVPHRGEGDYGLARDTIARENAARESAAREPHRPRQSMPWQRREESRVDEMRSPNVSEDNVSRSVRAVERAVENFAALQDNCDYYKEMALELRKAFDDEKEHAKVFAQQLADAEHSARAERDRADRAESRLELSAQATRELERQLATVRGQTDRLVQTIARLMSAEKGRGGKDVNIADLLAA